MVGEVCSAVDAAVGTVAAGQVRLESFGARHGDHGPGRRAVQEGAAGPGRLTREAPQHTGEGRGGAGWEVYTCTHTQGCPGVSITAAALHCLFERPLSLLVVRVWDGTIC